MVLGFVFCPGKKGAKVSENPVPQRANFAVWSSFFGLFREIGVCPGNGHFLGKWGIWGSRSGPDLGVIWGSQNWSWELESEVWDGIWWSGSESGEIWESGSNMGPSPESGGLSGIWWFGSIWVNIVQNEAFEKLKIIFGKIYPLEMLFRVIGCVWCSL